jgi:hypothetical protein
MSPSRWSAYRPSASAPWDLARAWTLRRRAGFAATWDELQRDLDGGPEAAVDRVLNGTGRIQGTVAEFAPTADLLGDAAASGGDIHRLEAWWLFRILFTPDLLTRYLHDARILPRHPRPCPTATASPAAVATVGSSREHRVATPVLSASSNGTPES